MPAVTLDPIETRGRATAAAPRLLAVWLLAATILVSAASSADAADVINVPADFSTIQAAIDAAAPGDTVTVAPGTYFENISFLGKDITVHSSGGAAVTTIDGQDLGSVVTIANGESSAAVLQGFTIQNGYVRGPNVGGGITILDSSPTIIENVITRNIGEQGGGISARLGAPLIAQNTISKNRGCQGNGLELSATSATVRSNEIHDNFRARCPTTGDGGGGIRIVGGDPLIIGNLISGNANTSGAAIGGSIASAQVIGNLVVDNVGHEAGIVQVHSGWDAVVANNVIARNVTTYGAAGISIKLDLGSPTRVINNTIYGNVSSWDGTDGIVMGNWGATPVVANNIIQASDGLAIVCDVPQPNAKSNNFFTSGPELAGADCGDLLAGDVNISLDPGMVAPELGDFSLLPGSPLVDAADNVESPADDFFGTSRPVDGDENGQSQSDIGAIELNTPYVTGMVTAGGAPVDQICVRAHSGPVDVEVAGFTNSSGQYVLPTPPGSYRIAFEDCSRGLFQSIWHGSATTYEAATPVDTSAGSASGIDAVLGFADGCDGKEPTLWGTSGDDLLTGTDGPDVIMALAGNDIVDGAGGNDTICGGDGTDTVLGGAGHDALFGNRGSDVLLGGPGDDDLRGGVGIDEVSYINATAAVVADISVGRATGEGTDSISGVENIRGSVYHDVIVGDAGRNALYGERGDDLIEGHGHRDTLSGGYGDDLMDGGPGRDDLAGGEGDDWLMGRSGDDKLVGGFGADLLQGGSGHDVLLGGTDNDYLIGGPGDDVLKGWKGNDTASYETAGRSVAVDLVAQTGTGQGVDTLESIESAVGSRFADTLEGSNRDNSLFGLGGRDTITGGPGDDVLDGGGRHDVLIGGSGRDLLLGGPGDDSLDGGTGADAASWQFSNDPVRADLTEGSATGQGTDTLTSIEDLVGSAHDDTLIGNSGENVLLGLGGADRMYGRSWHDRLFGGDGDDELYGEIGDDYLDGDRGSDMLNGGTGNDACVDGESHVSCEALGDVAADSDATLYRAETGYRVLAAWFREYVRPR